MHASSKSRHVDSSPFDGVPLVTWHQSAAKKQHSAHADGLLTSKAHIGQGIQALASHSEGTSMQVRDNSTTAGQGCGC